MKTLKEPSLKSLSVPVLCLLLVAAAHADEIHLYDGKPRTNVRVINETLDEVIFRLPDLRAEQTLPASDVKKVVYTRSYDRYDDAMRKMAEGDYKTAIQYFQAAAGGAPGSFAWVPQYALYNAAECFRALRDFDNAIRAYDELLKEVPDTKFFGECFLKKAQIYKAKNETEKARTTFERLKSEAEAKGLGKRWSLLAEYHLTLLDERKDLDAAFKRYEELQETAAKAGVPDVANLARLRLGNVYINQGKIAEAKEFFEDIIADRQASDVRTVAGAYLGLGNTYMKQDNPTAEDYNNALHCFLRVVTYYATEIGRDEIIAEALYWAGLCFDARTQNPEQDSRRAQFMYTRVKKEYPSTEWARLAIDR